MKKKILLVSLNAQDVFIGQLAKRLGGKEFSVWRFYVQEGRLYNYNEEKSVDLFGSPKSKGLSLFKMIQASLRMRKYVKKVDIVHYHYIDSTIALLSNFILPVLPFSQAVSRKRIYATFWGSDFYKASKKAVFLRQRLLKKATAISFTNHLTQQSFDTLYPALSNKTQTIRFGLIPLDDIKTVTTEDILKMKKGLELPINKKIVCLGTNASSNQNHEKILDSLFQESRAFIDKGHFLVPLGYPKSATNYIEELKAKVPDEWKAFFTFDTAFYSGKNLATYRACVDVLIQLQTTDQFSGAMQEVLASGGDVITASWLPYDLLREKKVHFYQIDDFSAISNTLNQVLLHPINPDAARHNSLVINSLSHWDEVILEWVALYN
jgi:hypothetical protein